jgi:hypothetical protein
MDQHVFWGGLVLCGGAQSLGLSVMAARGCGGAETFSLGRRLDAKKYSLHQP